LLAAEALLAFQAYRGKAGLSDADLELATVGAMLENEKGLHLRALSKATIRVMLIQRSEGDSDGGG
jgi:hypothetical protein